MLRVNLEGTGWLLALPNQHVGHVNGVIDFFINYSSFLVP